MPSIAAKIFTGPGVFKRESFTESPVTFGRESDNTIVLNEPTASRHHGELRHENGQWLLVNLSPNGTRVNGRNVTRKPHALRDSDEIAIGDKPIFAVTLGAATAEEPLPAAAEPAAPSISRRTKLWIGISIYVLIMLVGLLVFGPFLSDSSDSEGLKPLPAWSPDQIREAILTPLPAETPDPRESQKFLAIANEMFNRQSPSSRYDSYNAYRQALAYSGKNYFTDGLDQMRFQQVQEVIIDEVKTLYGDGYKQLRGGRYKDAERTFRRLNQEFFRDTTSGLYRHVEKQRFVAARNLKKRSW